MAKKIRLDFSKVEERSGWNTRQMPEGIHKVKIDAVEVTEAGDGTAMLVYALVPADAKYKTRRFPYYCKLQQNQLWKLRDLLVAAGVSVPKKALNIDPESPVGKFIAAEVEDETNAQYAGRSVIQGTYGLDILDEDGSIADSDEDDEDEYEGDEDEADEDYDDEPEDDEEEDEEQDLSTLTLAELRKLAKSLGIDTDGVKKAELIELIEEEQEASDDDEDEDDEDDLDDEELEDEDDDFDDEDEEEEDEEPAPKRPARKSAPAKSAPKRTVKRR
ncbi:hypothetical protein SEA_CHEETO1_36 [Microbacterium phage Cheeto1]|nr:hypothetical protein SEA_CHEETO1_36 [Microbacterium phage Cheeto1]